jgi:hypothetical protein
LTYDKGLTWSVLSREWVGGVSDRGQWAVRGRGDIASTTWRVWRMWRRHYKKTQNPKHISLIIKGYIINYCLTSRLSVRSYIIKSCHIYIYIPGVGWSLAFASSLEVCPLLLESTSDTPLSAGLGGSEPVQNTICRFSKFVQIFENRSKMMYINLQNITCGGGVEGRNAVVGRWWVWP